MSEKTTTKTPKTAAKGGKGTPKKNKLTGIRPLANGRFKVECMVKGVRKSGVADTLAEAVALRQELIDTAQEAALAEPLMAASKPERSASAWTLQQAVDKTFSLIWRDTADETRQRIRTRHLLEFFGSTCLLTGITPERIVEFREWAEAHLKNCPNTINKKVCSLSRILRTAVELGKLSKMPKLHLAKIRNNRIRFMTPEEEAQTLGTFKLLTSDDHVDAFIVLVDTGFRLGELWTLTAANINPLTGMVSLWDGETKNGLARTIPMTSRVKTILMKRRAKYPEGPLWPGRDNSWFQFKWNKVRAALGKENDPEWVTHMLRHTCCSRLVQAGVNLFLVQQWMGHRSLSITQRYAHHAPQHLQNAGLALERFTSELQTENSTATTAVLG